MPTSIRILILEDSEDDAILAERELRKAGLTFSLRRVESGEDFARALEEFHPDIILSDYSLPAFDGLSALRLARARCPQVPFIFVSGRIGEDNAIETLKIGATDYVLKNRLSRLALAVRRALQEAEERRRRQQAEEKILAYQEQLRALASRLSLTREMERRRIATDLHDQIGQSLALCKMKLGALRSSSGSSDLTQSLDEVRQLVEEAIRYARSLMYDLCSPLLYQVGLEAALEQLVETTQQRHGVALTFEDDGQEKPLTQEVRVLLFAAVRELLMNVVKHAQARMGKVSVQRVGHTIQITVEDDGVGFVVSNAHPRPTPSGGFGLFSIREGLSHFGGYIEVHSQRGQGTRVTLSAPLAARKNAKREA